MAITATSAAGESSSSLLGGMSRESSAGDLFHDQRPRPASISAAGGTDARTFTRFKELARTNSDKQRKPEQQRNRNAAAASASKSSAALSLTGPRARDSSTYVSSGAAGRGRPRPPLKSRQTTAQTQRTLQYKHQQRQQTQKRSASAPRQRAGAGAAADNGASTTSFRQIVGQHRQREAARSRSQSPIRYANRPSLLDMVNSVLGRNDILVDSTHGEDTDADLDGADHRDNRSARDLNKSGAGRTTSGQSTASRSRSDSRSKSRGSGSHSGGASVKSHGANSRSIKQRRLEALNHQAELHEQELLEHDQTSRGTTSLRGPGTRTAPNAQGVRKPGHSVSDAGGASYSVQSLPVTRGGGNPVAGATVGPAPLATQSFMKRAMYRNAKPLDTGLHSSRQAAAAGSNIEHTSMVHRASRMSGAQEGRIKQTPTTSYPSKSQPSGGCPPFPIISNFELRPEAKEQLRRAQDVNDGLSEENARLRSEIILIEERVSKMESIFATSTAKSSDKMRQMERLYQSKLTSLENRNHDLISANEDLVDTIRSLEQDNMDLQRQLNGHNDQAHRTETLQRQLNERKELSTVLEQELNEVWEENEENKKTIDDLREECDRANIKAENLAQDLEDESHETQRLRTRLDALDNADSAKQEDRIKALEMELDKTLQSGMERIRKLEVELKEERAEVRMLKARLAWEPTDSRTDKEIISPNKSSFADTTSTDTKKQDNHVHFDNMPPRNSSSLPRIPSDRRVSQRSNITADTAVIANLSKNRGRPDRPSRIFSFASSGELSSTIFEEVEVTDVGVSPSSEAATNGESNSKARTDRSSRETVQALQHFESGINSPNERGDTDEQKNSGVFTDTTDDGTADAGENEMMPIGEVSSEQEGKRKSWLSENTDDDYSDGDLNAEDEARVDKNVTAILEARANGILGSLDSDKALVQNDRDNENDISSTITGKGSNNDHGIDLVKLNGSSNTLASELGDSWKSGLDVGARHRVAKHFGW